MSAAADGKHPVIAALDVVIFLLAGAEFVEAVFHFDLWGWMEGEAGLQLVLLAVRAYAVWHAFHVARH